VSELVVLVVQTQQGVYCDGMVVQPPQCVEFLSVTVVLQKLEGRPIAAVLGGAFCPHDHHSFVPPHDICE